MATPTKKLDSLDQAKLMGMQDPIQLRVEKLKGGVKVPIDLPPKEGMMPGAGLTREDVLTIDKKVLELPGGGGGIYEAQATDAAGNTLRWTWGYPTTVWPELAPTGVPQQAAAPVAQFGQAPDWGAWGGYTQPAATPRPQAPWAVGPWGQPSPWGPPMSQQFFPQQNQNDDRIRNLEDQLARERLERKELEYKAQLVQVQQQHEAALKAMQDEIRRLADNKRPAEETSTVEALRAEIREQAARSERDRQEDRHRQELMAMQQKMDQLLLSQQQNRPDPMIDFMKENSRQQSELAKELSRQQQAQMDKMAAYTVNPIQVAAMLKDQSNGNDAFMKQMIGSVTGVVEMYKHAAEQVVQMAGGGQPSMAEGLVRDGLQGAKDILGQYFAVKQNQAMMQARAQAQHAQMMAMQAQAQQRGQVAPATPWAPPPQAVQAQPQPPVQQELAGVVVQPQPVPANGDVKPMANIQAQMPSDEQLFGPATESIRRLRDGVANGLLEPGTAVEAILKGADELEKRKIVVPVFLLFEEERYADLMDVLLPKAPQAFKDECVRIFNEEVGEEEDDEEDDPDPAVVQAGAS